jgi:hypothetical protein
MSGRDALIDALDATNGSPPRASIVLRHISAIVAERREPRWLLYKIIERGVLAVLAGPRATFKSFIALDWAMRTAMAGNPVLILSGEGAGLDRRIDAWMREHAATATLDDLPVRAVERPLRLTANGDLAQLAETIRASDLRPTLVVVDTLSKFAAGLDENSNPEVAQFLSDLATELRDSFDATVLLVAHAGHGDAKRPRGAYALMANPDAEYIVERPSSTAMTVTVSRERFKDYPALEPLAYSAEVIDLGRTDSHGERVTSLVLRSTQAPAARPTLTGRVQTTAWTALREWSRQHPDARTITTRDLHELFKVHGIDRRRKLDVTNALVNARALTASIGGYSLDPEAMSL